MTATAMTWIWLAAAFISVLIEVATPSFGFVLVAAAAAAAAAVSAVGLNPFVQFMTFGVSSLFLLLFLRPRILAKIGPSPGVPDRAERMVGRRGRVTEAVDPVSGRGRVLVDGQDWAASHVNPIAEGAEIVVEGHAGIKLVVAPVPSTKAA